MIKSALPKCSFSKEAYSLLQIRLGGRNPFHNSATGAENLSTTFPKIHRSGSAIKRLANLAQTFQTQALD